MYLRLVITDILATFNAYKAVSVLINSIHKIFQQILLYWHNQSTHLDTLSWVTQSPKVTVCNLKLQYATYHSTSVRFKICPLCFHQPSLSLLCYTVLHHHYVIASDIVFMKIQLMGMRQQAEITDILWLVRSMSHQNLLETNISALLPVVHSEVHDITSWECS